MRNTDDSAPEMLKNSNKATISLPARASEQGNVIGLVSVYISESTVVLSM